MIEAAHKRLELGVFEAQIPIQVLVAGSRFREHGVISPKRS